MQLSGKPAEENASDENKNESDIIVKNEDGQNSENTPLPDTEAPPDAPEKLGEDITVKTPDDTSMDGRQLHYTPDVIVTLESDTKKAMIASVKDMEALIASAKDTDDISDLEKAMIASISSPAAAKIASIKDKVDKDKQITALMNLINVMQNTVDAQSKNQVVLREAFAAEKTLSRKFRNIFDKNLKDEMAKLMRIVEGHNEQQRLIINNESAVTNAFVRAQALENSKFQEQTNVQIQDICDSLTQLRSNFMSGTYASADDQSYVEDDEEESHASHNDKRSDDEIDNRERAPDDEWVPGGNVPKCQYAPCMNQAFLGPAGYSIACSRGCFRRLTGNPPGGGGEPPKNHSKNRSKPQKRSPGSHHVYSRQHHRQHHHSHQPHHPPQWDDQAISASKSGSKSADEGHRGWGESPPSSTYTALEDEISVLGGQSCGQSLRPRPPAASRSKSQGISPETSDTILALYIQQQIQNTVPTLDITAKKNFKFSNEVTFQLRMAVGGSLDSTNFTKLIESINRTIKLKNQGYVTEPNAYERVREVLTQCLDACISAENNTLATMILEKINLMKDNPNSYEKLIDIEFASKLRSCPITYHTIATMNYVDQAVAESMSSDVTKYLPSYGDRISELPPTPPDKALQLLGITCLTIQCFKVILKLIGFANKAILAKLIVNLQNITITRSQWKSYKTLVTYYYSLFKAMRLICFLVPELVPPNTAAALDETFFDSLSEALKATPSVNDISKLPFAHDDTNFLLSMTQFKKDNEDKPLSDKMPRFIALLEELELDSTAPKADTFNTPKNFDRRPNRTPALAGVVTENDPNDPPAWNQDRSKKQTRKPTKSDDTADGIPMYDEKIRKCASCGGNRDPNARNTCVKNITGDRNCPVKSTYYTKLNIAGGRHPTRGDNLPPRDGYVCFLCGCGGHGSKFCPYSEPVQKDGRNARKKIVDTIRSSLLSKHKKNSSMGARVSQKKPAWAESNSDTDIDDDEDIDNIMDTDGELKPNDGEKYSLVVTGKKKNNGTFNMRWERSA